MPDLETATLAMGCFWCTEAVFKELKGVKSVIPGYTEGAETAQIKYDPKQISFKDLLEVFWRVHDPTTKDQQGNDIGPQYRSVIFYHNEDQKKTAEESKKRIEQSGIYDNPIVTEIVSFSEFNMAEDYHINFYEKNRNQPYCKVVIDPKLAKFRKEFKNKLKEDNRN